MLGTILPACNTDGETIFCTTAWKRKVYRYTELQADCPLENAHLAFPFCCVNNSQLTSESLSVIMKRIIHKNKMIIRHGLYIFRVFVLVKAPERRN